MKIDILLSTMLVFDVVGVALYVAVEKSPQIFTTLLYVAVETSLTMINENGF